MDFHSIRIELRRIFIQLEFRFKRLLSNQISAMEEFHPIRIHESIIIYKREGERESESRKIESRDAYFLSYIAYIRAVKYASRFKIMKISHYLLRIMYNWKEKYILWTLFTNLFSFVKYSCFSLIKKTKRAEPPLLNYSRDWKRLEKI